MVLSGFWCLMFLTGSNQLVQISSNMGIRGRVMSLYIMVLIGGQAIGGPMLGWIAEHLDPHVALLVSGGVPALAALTVGVVLARQGCAEAQGGPEGPPPPGADRQPAGGSRLSRNPGLSADLTVKARIREQARDS